MILHFAVIIMEWI